MNICSNTNCSKEANNKYCSRPCANEEINKLRTEKFLRESSERKCAYPECDNSMEGKEKRQKYCGHSCAKKVTNRQRNGMTYATSLEWRSTERICDSCGERYLPKEKRQKNCSRYCYVIVRRERNIESWLQTNASVNNINGLLPKWAREHLLEEANHRCTRCGWGEINPKVGKPILTIDHIDGDWKNNRRDNLVVLCYNCHTLTSTFGSLNAGKVDNWDRPGTFVRDIRK